MWGSRGLGEMVLGFSGLGFNAFLKYFVAEGLG